MLNKMLCKKKTLRQNEIYFTCARIMQVLSFYFPHACRQKKEEFNIHILSRESKKSAIYTEKNVIFLVFLKSFNKISSE